MKKTENNFLKNQKTIFWKNQKTIFLKNKKQIVVKVQKSLKLWKIKKKDQKIIAGCIPCKKPIGKP